MITMKRRKLVRGLGLLLLAAVLAVCFLIALVYITEGLFNYVEDNEYDKYKNSMGLSMEAVHQEFGAPDMSLTWADIAKLPAGSQIVIGHRDPDFTGFHILEVHAMSDEGQPMNKRAIYLYYDSELVLQAVRRGYRK